ncbi:hypothetical protein SRHO_G00182610 [Serrasalmus rhombeus]
MLKLDLSDETTRRCAFSAWTFWRRLLDLGKEKLGLVTGQVNLLAVAGDMVGSEESRSAQEEDREFFWPFHSSMAVDRANSSAVRQPAKVRARPHTQSRVY